MSANENQFEDQEMDTVTLTMDDGTEEECAILAIYPAGDKQYIALMPLRDEDDDQEDDIYIYRFIGHGEDEDPDLENIETDEEFDIASDAFDELLDNWEFDEMEE